MKTLSLFIKITLCYFCVLLIAYAVCLGVLWSHLSHIQSIESDDFAERLATEEPLVASEYVQSLDYLSLREKSYELIRTYNRRSHIISIVRERLRMLRQMDKVNSSVEDVVERNLAKMEEDNVQIKKHYERIADFAEVQHARSFLKSHSPDAENKARLFASENQELLKSVEVPMSFK